MMQSLGHPAQAEDRGERESEIIETDGIAQGLYPTGEQLKPLWKVAGHTPLSLVERRE
jgi:hypothetical protein